MKIDKLLFAQILIGCFLIVGCTSKIKETKHQFTNNLIHETSPYLLQHAHNPVHWNAWNDSTLTKAKKGTKLLIISIGYAACHWCHVMEEESFEDSLVAKTMNKDFINIKVDREERPDVDKVYMKAVQLMTGKGGWPLNIIALPDGRPIFGGTYFSKEQWKNALEKITEGYKKNPEEFYAFAERLQEGIKGVDLIELNPEKASFTKSFIQEEVKKWSASFDNSYGGASGAPKFMMPNNYQFLLRYAYQNKDKEVMSHVNKTLDRMAFGGIFDHIRGGFSRYATDEKWHIPHFEKMLYDNAQLVSLYAKAYQLSRKDEYKKVVVETLDFIRNELTSKEGMFYSSLDADSYNHENILEEGAYYTWTKEELKDVLGDDFGWFSKYYNVNDFGHWEDGKFVLIRSVNDITFSKANNINLSQLEKMKYNWKKALKKVQENRKAPRLDDKSLTSWNALMICGYLEAYNAFNNQSYLEIAIKNASFIANTLLLKNGKLYHNYKNGKVTINGFLEDYAATIQAFIKLHEITSDEFWLQKAADMTQYTIANFYDEKSKMFFFSSKLDVDLTSETIEYYDNVIPSSNSIMAKNLFSLSHHLSNKDYKEKAIAMLNNIKPQIAEHASSFSNWLDFMSNNTHKYYEVVIVGEEAEEKRKELQEIYLPNVLLSISKKESNLPLLVNRYVEGETYIYVCTDNTCKFPVTTITETLKFIEN